MTELTTLDFDELEINRLQCRDNRRRCMFYPEDTLKGYWDLVISLILIITCSITPFAIAFYEQNDTSWNVFDFVTDIFFFVDIIIIFNTAFYDMDYKIVD